MRHIVRNSIIGGIIGAMLFSVIASSNLYKHFKKATRSISRDFTNWGEEFI